MNTSWLALAAVASSAELGAAIERAALALGRLDARVCASFARTLWHERTLLTGAAATLTARGQPVAEINLFTVSGVALPAQSRVPTSNTCDGVQLVANWRAALAQTEAPHWRDLIGGPLDLPANWSRHPGLLRTLALAAQHANEADLGTLPVLPQLLQALGLTRAVLPNLALADPVWRYPPRELAGSAKRMLRQLAAAAVCGLARLHRLERDQLRATQVLAAQTRPGGLREVLALAEAEGAVTPRGLAGQTGLSLSGAGKQLARAAALGLLVEVTGRISWRTYLVPDLARQFGYVSIPKGRPPAPALPAAPLDAKLAAFDAEMVEIDALLARTSSEASDGD